MVTAAPETKAPETSRTTPVSVAPTTCARSVATCASNRAGAREKNLMIRIVETSLTRPSCRAERPECCESQFFRLRQTEAQTEGRSPSASAAFADQQHRQQREGRREPARQQRVVRCIRFI